MKELTNSVTRRTFFAAGGLGALAALGGPRLLAAQTQGSLGTAVSPEVQRANVQVVNSFCAAFADRDPDLAP